MKGHISHLKRQHNPAADDNPLAQNVGFISEQLERMVSPGLTVVMQHNLNRDVVANKALLFRTETLFLPFFIICQPTK
jgi:hypothetical protein